jgi:hypothetical protein
MLLELKHAVKVLSTIVSHLSQYDWTLHPNQLLDGGTAAAMGIPTLHS